MSDKKLRDLTLGWRSPEYTITPYSRQNTLFFFAQVCMQADTGSRWQITAPDSLLALLLRSHHSNLTKVSSRSRSQGYVANGDLCSAEVMGVSGSSLRVSAPSPASISDRRESICSKGCLLPPFRCSDFGDQTLWKVQP